MECKILLRGIIVKKYLKLISIVSSSFLINSSFSQQNIKNYVQANIVKINSIHPDSTNYDDLNTLGNAVGNCSVVMLGEQDHGDAATFLAKTRIIKYLHEKKGFNVLAFESDCFGFNYGWENIKKDKLTMDSAIKKNIAPMWSATDACSNLFYEYIPSLLNTKTPLRIAGFDIALGTTYAFEKIDSIINKTEIAFGKKPE